MTRQQRLEKYATSIGVDGTKVKTVDKGYRITFPNGMVIRAKDFARAKVVIRGYTDGPEDAAVQPPTMSYRIVKKNLGDDDRYYEHVLTFGGKSIVAADTYYTDSKMHKRLKKQMAVFVGHVNKTIAKEMQS